MLPLKCFEKKLSFELGLEISFPKMKTPNSSFLTIFQKEILQNELHAPCLPFDIDIPPDVKFYFFFFLSHKSFSQI